MKLKFGIKRQKKITMMMNKHISLIILLVFSGFSINAQNKNWSLEACVNHALEHNISVQQAGNTLLLNDQDIKAAKGQFLPSVSASVSQSLSIGKTELFLGNFVDRTSHSTSIGVGANQLVFNGFRLTNLYKQSQLNKEANTLELNRIKDNIALNVVNSYLNILFTKERLETAQAQLNFSKKQLEQVKAFVDAGVQPKANIYDAEATLSSDAQNFTTAENNYNLALLNLSQLLQVPYQGFSIEVINVDTPSEALLYKDVNPILEYAYKNRNEVKVAEKNIEIAALQTEISKSGFLPSVNLGYSFGSSAFYSNLADTELPVFEQLNDQKSHRLNLSVNIPIFSRHANKTAVAKSKIQHENAKLNLNQTKLSLETNIQRAYTDAHAALKAYIAAQKSLEAQKLSFNNSKERFDIGVMNAFELEQARIRLINAESALINAKYDFVFKTKVLDFYMGKPID